VLLETRAAGDPQHRVRDERVQHALEVISLERYVAVKLDEHVDRNRDLLKTIEE